MHRSESPQGLAGKLRPYLSHLLAFGAVVVIVVGAIFLLREGIEDPKALIPLAETLGYLGAFLISLASSASIAFPAPGAVVVFALGGILNPVLVALAAAPGETLGELTGYLAGYAGNPLVAKSRLYMALEGWMRRHGAVTMFLLSAIPNPVFDIGGAMAGAVGFPVGKFLLVVLAGKLIKSLAIALGGDLFAPFLIERFF